MNIENEKIRQKIYKIENKLDKNNKCKSYKNILKKLNKKEIFKLYISKFITSVKINGITKKQMIEELKNIHISEFDIFLN